MMRPLRKPPAHQRREMRRSRRAGLTLLEVIIALAIFLFSLTALSHLLSLSSDQVLTASLRSQATQRCQSKLAEVVAGVQPLSSSGWSSFSDDPEWSWQVNCTQGDVPNLWTVQVGVRRKRSNDSYVEVSVSQMVVAPAARGSTLVTPSPSGSGSNGGNSGTGSGNMGSTGP
jgi:general secretion pathway protein I